MKPLFLALFLLSATSYSTNAQENKAPIETMDIDYITIQKSDDFDQVVLSFVIEKDPVFRIGEKMNEIKLIEIELVCVLCNLII